MAVNRQVLLSEVRDVLVRAGFCASEPMDPWTATFDLVARRDQVLLVIKAYSNIDRLSKESADLLRALASTLGAAPMVVGMRTSRGELEEGVLYLRHAVPIISLGTLQDHLLEGVPPFVFAGPGGHYVSLDGDAIARARSDRGLSLSEMAEATGVSRRTISMYEQGMAAQVDSARRLEQFLGVPLVHALDPFSNRPELEERRATLSGLQEIEHDVFSRLEGLGYRVLPTTGCPFDALSSARKNVFLTAVKAGAPDLQTRVRARTIAQVARVAERESVLFVERDVDRTQLEGTPVIARQELERMGDPEEILRLIRERGGRTC
jgi:putative transcriptional regulator